MTDVIEPEARPLDRAPVEALALGIMTCVKMHFHGRPRARSTAQEVLNALAIAAAIVIHGTGSDESRQEARAFFERALNEQMADLTENLPEELQ